MDIWYAAGAMVIVVFLVELYFSGQEKKKS
jgi:hypothetical protein